MLACVVTVGTGACAFELGSVRSSGGSDGGAVTPGADARAQPDATADAADAADATPPPVDGGPLCCGADLTCATPRAVPLDGGLARGATCEARTVCGRNGYAAYFKLGASPSGYWFVTATSTVNIALSTATGCASSGTCAAANTASITVASGATIVVGSVAVCTDVSLTAQID